MSWPIGPMGHLAARFAGLSRWRRRGMALGAGALAALALPPVHLIPVLLISFPVLVWLLDGTHSRKAAFSAGWWFGLGWFTLGLYWIAHALLIEPERFGWMIPFATLGLGSVLAVFTGIATLLASMAVRRGPGRVFALAAGWGFMEWVRSWAFTGFPWNPVGSVWDPVLPMLQIGSVIGVFGLSTLTVLTAALPAISGDHLSGRGKFAFLSMVAALPAALFLWGSARLDQPRPGRVEDVRLRLVQANIAQSHKWQEELRQDHLDQHLLLSRAEGFESVSHVIWPETAAPFFLDVDARHRNQVAFAVPPGGYVITGAPRIAEKPFRIWNSLMAVSSQADLAGLYDKVHLVPFGEYVPLRAVLPIDKITHGGTDFLPGPGLRTMDLPGLPPFSPLICYEAIFPGAVVGRDQPRPQWLLNITNDAWFGLSAGPYQHLASARMRAIEEGLPLVRVANTGISAVFDPYGREMARLDLGQRGVVDSPLSKPLSETVFGRFGNLSGLFVALSLLLSGLYLRFKHIGHGLSL